MNCSAVPPAPTGTDVPRPPSRPGPDKAPTSKFASSQLDTQALRSLLASRQKLEPLVRPEGSHEATEVIEALDRVLDLPDLNDAERNRGTVALSKLCSRYGALPESCKLTDHLEKTSSELPHASGGFADVYRGRCGNRMVAIKALRLCETDDHKKMQTRFCKEVVMWKRLSHPNVLPFLGVSFQAPLRLWMVSIWMTHENIVKYVKGNPGANRILLLSDVASGLSYLHTNNLVHGDLKGLNILINNDYRACLADFGLMVILHDSTTVHATSAVNEGGGTLRWMAPELLFPEEHGFTRCSPSKKSDIYAMGMVIYEVMTGNNPFHECQEDQVVACKVLLGLRPCRPMNSAALGLSDDLWQTAERCWHQEWEKRPSIVDVLGHLNATACNWVPLSPRIGHRDPDPDADSSTTNGIYFTPRDVLGQDNTTIPTGDKSPQATNHAQTGGIEQDTSVDAHSPRSSSVPLTRRLPQVASSAGSTASESFSSLNQTEIKKTGFFGRLRGTSVGSSHESAKDIRKQKRFKGVTNILRRALLRPDTESRSSLDQGSLSLVCNCRRTHHLEDMEEAIAQYRSAIAFYPPGDPIRFNALNGIAVILLDRFGCTQKLEDADEAVTHYHEALILRPSGHPGRSESLNNIAVALVTRYRGSQKFEDLETAIMYYHKALNLRPPGHPDRSESLNNIAVSLVDRFRRKKTLMDVEAAISYYREALALHPPVWDPDHSELSNNIAVALLERFRRTHKLEDVNEAIHIHRRILGPPPHEHPNQSESLNNIAATLVDRFRLTQRLEDADEAINYHLAALALLPRGQPDRIPSLIGVAVALLDRFNRTCRLEDLDTATNYSRESMDLCPRGHPDRCFSLNTIARATYYRIEQSGGSEDLQEAKACSLEALKLCPPGHPARCASLNNAARAHVCHSGEDQTLTHLKEAIAHSREALDLRPPGHLDWFNSLINLVNIATSFKRMGEMKDLRDAVELLSTEVAKPVEHTTGHIKQELTNLEQKIAELQAVAPIQ